MKVVEKIAGAQSDDHPVVFSFEFFTPKISKNTTPAAAGDAFISLVTRMVAHKPSFCDITWRPNDPYPAITLDLAGRMQSKAGVETMLHLTCIGMPLARIDAALDEARARGVRNILALRGDPLPNHNPDPTELTSALDLVRHIRARYGDYFGIAVAGYPEAHPSKIPADADTAPTEAYEEDLAYLKEKVDAGADLVITQLFFDAEVFVKFVGDCRRIGIECPLVPGILPIATYRNFKYMTTTCRTKVPPEVRAAVEAAREDDAALAAYGVAMATAMCKRILESGIGVKALHFYTMNREGPAVAVLRNLGLLGGGDDEVKLQMTLENGKKLEAKKEYANGIVEGIQVLS